jgi:sigma-B regulation protein RsbU (phosphoserine phosphatase)
LLYTDGLTEAFSIDGEFYGETRLLEKLQTVRVNSADELLGVVEADFNEYTDPLPPADDITLLAVRRV